MHRFARTVARIKRPAIRKPAINTGWKTGCLTWVAACLLFAAHAQQTAAVRHVSMPKQYGDLPLSFEANQGQTEPQVQFLARGRGYQLFLADSAAVLALTKDASLPGHMRNRTAPMPNRAGRTVDVVRMELLGASHAVPATATDRLPGSINYFIGNDASKWHAGVPTYSQSRVRKRLLRH